MTKLPTTDIIKQLVQVNDSVAGWTRCKEKERFIYLNENGGVLNRKEELERIKQLVIPPIWSDVWICKLPNGHLQSTGRDLRRRKQYIYHPDWTAYRQAMKFRKIRDFAYQLPKLRKTAAVHLKDKSWTKRKVLALIVQVLDNCHIRIGNKYYKEKNNTFGLTTLRRKHLEITDDNLIRFEYKAKSNKYRKVSMDSRKLAKLVQQCSELRGYEVFRYQENGKTYPIDSSDVNTYIQEIAGEQFSAKDFRTWAGTSLAVENY
ncbi:MAG: DNA topoisomerase IB, partial [Saprospiraceae bacterium]